ncbi:MAG: pantoate--beta-alanine ligase [Bacillus thermozeamaize]|uniref:Pantothenate synthetase n=1 Tax=Bacillus thermozeamaize TaxID=230954 RepID=A0A1Y3PQN5_9BACI|nr:MAG: pantoate--beta-alanine ligase [Bacillus thermozeamaize]
MSARRPMEVITTIEALRSRLAQERQAGKQIGLVPTMGYLHAGHLSLIRKAREECDCVVMSLFVNPLQFGENEDFDRYPRDFERDRTMAEEAGVDLLFYPSVEEMYPRRILTTVHVAGLTERLCGRSRPGHFDGVATVVSKLFHIVCPDRAYFGQKDAQQLAVIERMVEDLNIPVKVVGCPIIREPDGLAMSSRNVYLTPEERKAAPTLYQALQEGERLIRGGERNPNVVLQTVRQQIERAKVFRLDYLELLSYPDLEPLDAIGGKVILAVAAWLGRTRLIDNTIIEI